MRLLLDNSDKRLKDGPINIMELDFLFPVFVKRKVKVIQILNFFYFQGIKNYKLKSFVLMQKKYLAECAMKMNKKDLWDHCPLFRNIYDCSHMLTLPLNLFITNRVVLNIK